MEFKPVLLSGQAEVEYHLQKNKSEVADLFERQLKELFVIHHLQVIRNKEEIDGMPEFKKFCEDKAGAFNHFYFPWLNKIFKVADKNDYFTLKTNRNRDLISATEQASLQNFTVVVIGLSVGSNIAYLLTQAGFSNKIFLADPDTLDTTNLNRIFSGLGEVGVNKAILAARKIYEGNPYAEVEPMTEGINAESLEKLLAAKAVDCIVEEVDSLPVKIVTRKLAKKYRVPVVMITDNGFKIVLHVERYDLGHDKIFEKEESYWDNILSRELNVQVVSQLIAQDIIGGMDKVDPKLIDSGMKVFEKKLVSWPQLGSTAMLGGVVITQMIKRIALNESKELFIKRYIDLEI